MPECLYLCVSMEQGEADKEAQSILQIRKYSLAFKRNDTGHLGATKSELLPWQSMNCNLQNA